MTTPEPPEQLYGTSQAARIVGIPIERLRECVRHGLIAPRRTPRGHLRFDFLDLVLLRTTRGLLRERVPLPRIARILHALREQSGARPLTNLSVSVDAGRVVACDGAARWQPESGQFMFTFDADETAPRPAGVSRLPAPTPKELPRLSADEWCDLAMEIESTSPLEARAAYHHALDLDPDHLVARVNLGRLLHADASLRGAEAHFREAVRSDPSCALAWYNLGVVLEDAGRRDEAIEAYAQAVARDPNLADAHWNLSLLYEQTGQAQDALRHLMVYRRLTGPSR